MNRKDAEKEFDGINRINRIWLNHKTSPFYHPVHPVGIFSFLRAFAVKRDW